MLSKFYNAHGWVFEDILMKPHDTKYQPMSCHILRLPPWHNIGQICIGFKVEEHIWIQSGGSINYSVLFYLACHTRWLFGDESTFTESTNTYDFVL
jgi:hypothetical protein